MDRPTSDLRAAFQEFRIEWIPGAISLMIGLVIAGIVYFASSIGILALFFGSGGKLPLWMANLPAALGGIFLIVAFASVIRSAMFIGEDGSTSRSIAWQAVPTGVLGVGVITLLLAFFGTDPVEQLLASFITMVVLWMVVLAIVDVVAGNGDVGLRAPFAVIANDPRRAVTNIAATFLLVDVPVTSVFLFVSPWIACLLAPAVYVFKSLLAIQWYGHAFELPSEARTREAAETADRKSSGRGRSTPSFLVEAGETHTGSAVLDTPLDASHGVWIDCGHCGMFRATIGSALAPPRMLVTTQAGTWSELAEDGRGSFVGTVPAGPWFVWVETAPAGCALSWTLVAAATTESRAA